MNWLLPGDDQVQKSMTTNQTIYYTRPESLSIYIHYSLTPTAVTALSQIAYLSLTGRRDEQVYTTRTVVHLYG